MDLTIYTGDKMVVQFDPGSTIRISYLALLEHLPADPISRLISILTRHTRFCELWQIQIVYSFVGRCGLTYEFYLLYLIYGNSWRIFVQSKEISVGEKVAIFILYWLRTRMRDIWRNRSQSWRDMFSLVSSLEVMIMLWTDGRMILVLHIRHSMWTQHKWTLHKRGNRYIYDDVF